MILADYFYEMDNEGLGKGIAQPPLVCLTTSHQYTSADLQDIPDSLSSIKLAA